MRTVSGSGRRAGKRLREGGSRAACGTGTLRGSTLVETLVMMLVAGIIFLSVMDGLTLFARLQTRRAQALVEAGRQREGFGRLEGLLAAADSVIPQLGYDDGFGSGQGALRCWRAGVPSQLLWRDGVLAYRVGGFCDTLLREIEAVHFTQGVRRMEGADEVARQIPFEGSLQTVAADTLEVRLHEGHVLRFAVRVPPAVRYEKALAAIEKGYGYEEE